MKVLRRDFMVIGLRFFSGDLLMIEKQTSFKVLNVDSSCVYSSSYYQLS